MFDFVNNPAVNEPFAAGRSSSRMFFDFALLLSCVKENASNKRTLDFACGTGWIAEFLSRAGFESFGCDISADVIELAKKRAESDARIDSSRLTYFVSDGHAMDSVEDNFFSNIVCFDSLHHMHDFERTFKELFRILAPGGRAVFVEPGSKHSTSKETIDFIETYKKHDPTWIERDIVLEEINTIATQNGFLPLRIKPFLLPDMIEYSLHDWLNFKSNDRAQAQYMSLLQSFNYESRVVFYFDKN